MAEITRDTTGNKIGTGTGGIELAPASTEPVTINNGVMLPDGSLAEPSVRFNDDTNTGILSLTNDQINMAAHGVELTRFTGVASAVNYLELKNSITTADLSIGAVGTDTNISINLIPKGSGTLKVGGTNVALVGANLSTFTNDSGFITGFTETNDLTAAVTWANIPDANVPQTAVTQHQAALSITESQISDLGTYLTDIVSDTTPQLGSNLDVQSNSITTSTLNGGITLTPNGTGDVTLGTMVFDADQTIGAGQDNYVLTYDNGTGKISLEAAAGGGGLNNVVEDTTPQLGGNLDVQANSITTSTTNGGITLTPNGTGNVTLGTMVFDADQTIGAGQDNYVLTYDNAAGTISLEAAGGGGEDYFVCNSTGTLPTAAGGDGISIGEATVCNGHAGVAIGALAQCDGAYAVSIGGGSSATNTPEANGDFSIAIGLNAYANTTESIAVGRDANVTGTGGVAIGKSASVSTLVGIAIGQSALASGSYASALGNFSDANHSYSTSIGTYSITDFPGDNAFSSGPGPSQGSTKTSIITMWKKTTDGTQVELGSGTFDDTPTNYLNLPNNTTWFFDINIVARRTDADNENAAYTLKFCIKRDSNAASTALVGSLSKTVIAEDTAAWDVDVTVDTTNGRPAIKVTGEAAKTIRWVATVLATKVGE